MVKKFILGMFVFLLAVQMVSAFSYRWNSDFSEMHIDVEGHINTNITRDYTFIRGASSEENSFTLFTDPDAPRDSMWNNLTSVLEDIEADYRQEVQEQSRFDYLVDFFNRFDLLSALASLKLGQSVSCDFEEDGRGGYILRCTPS